MNDIPAFRFAVASDGHYGEPGNDSAHNFGEFSRCMIREKEEKGLDLFVFNGDLVHVRPEYLQTIKDR